jgi:hypothetical protein
MHWIGASRNEDPGYYPGDNVTISVSKYVPNGKDESGIPQPSGSQIPSAKGSVVTSTIAISRVEVKLSLLEYVDVLMIEFP